MHAWTPARDDPAVGLLVFSDNTGLMFPRYLDVPLLLSWLSARQYAPEGGFSGRTNKLVDGCYSHWVGGCSPLIEAALNGPQTTTSTTKPTISSLYSEEGLTRYILSCCQNDDGGLRDKPSTWVVHILGPQHLANSRRLDIQTPITHAIPLQVSAHYSIIAATLVSGTRKRRTR